MPVAFGEFILDVDRRRLLEGDRHIHLTPKAFELLHLLVARSPRALSKDEIISNIWADTFVSESSLSTLVGDLRTALHDDAQQPRFIRTVYSYGYAFAGELQPWRDGHAARSPWRIVYEHREIALPAGESILGRSGRGVVAFDVPGVSRRHARLRVEGCRVTVEDLGSKNGTWVGGTPATAPLPVSDGDELRLGPIVVLVRSVASESATETIVPAGNGQPARPPTQSCGSR